MTERFERFLMSISEIEYSWHKIATDELALYGLKGSYAAYLTTLRRYPEGISSAKLGELCRRDKSDVSRAVSDLEKKGFVRREGGSAGLYRARLILTEAGLALSETVCRKASLAVELAGSGLTDEQRAGFQSSLDLIAENLNKLSKNGLPQD